MPQLLNSFSAAPLPANLPGLELRHLGSRFGRPREGANALTGYAAHTRPGYPIQKTAFWGRFSLPGHYPIDFSFALAFKGALKGLCVSLGLGQLAEMCCPALLIAYGQKNRPFRACLVGLC